MTVVTVSSTGFIGKHEMDRSPSRGGPDFRFERDLATDRG